MVQLKVVGDNNKKEAIIRFQFLHGTIKSIREAKPIDTYRDFNSFMVQLKGTVKILPRFYTLISIPSWYN